MSSPSADPSPAIPALDTYRPQIDALMARHAYPEAVGLCQEAIERFPDQPEAYKWLGNALLLQDKLAPAARAFAKALALQPAYAEAHASLGNVHYKQGQWSEAIACYQRAVALQPDLAAAYWMLANACERSGDLDAAIDARYTALSRQPNLAEAETHNNLGNLLVQRGRPEAAIACYQRAIARKPGYALASLNLGHVYRSLERYDDAIEAFRNAWAWQSDLTAAGIALGITLLAAQQYGEASATLQAVLTACPESQEALYALGVARLRQEQYDEAIATFETALRPNPNSVEALCGLGEAHTAKGNLSAAIACFQAAVAADPQCAPACTSLAAALVKDRQFDAAIAACQQALNLEPTCAIALATLGLALLLKGDPRAALPYCEQAIALDATLAIAHSSLGEALILLGEDWSRGFAEYEWRWQHSGPLGARFFPQPAWDGSPLTGKGILLWTEQGVGEDILFAHAIPDVLQAAKICVIECENRMVPLYARSFPTAIVVPRTDPPQPRTLAIDIDVQSPLGSLLRWLRPSPEAVPSRTGYLKPDALRASIYRERYQHLGSGPKVGIAWHSTNPNKDCPPLEAWEAVLTVPGICFIDLQYDDRGTDRDRVRERFGISIYRDADIDPLQSLDDFAAQVAALDLVLSSSQTAAHMAGAVGQRVWTILSATPTNWYWGISGDRTPWYPTMRLFRQTQEGNWADVCQRVGNALRQFVAHPTPS